MAFPDTPTFLGPGREDLWWRVREPAAVRVCASSGLAFVQLLQATLKALIPQVVRGFDGQNVGGSLIVVDGIWGPMTQRALFQALLNRNAPDSFLGYVRAEQGGVGGRVGLRSFGAALWLMHRVPVSGTAGQVSAADIIVEGTTVMPAWSRAGGGASVTAGGTIVCRAQPAASQPQAPVPPPPPVTNDTTPMAPTPPAPTPGVPAPANPDTEIVPTTGVQIRLPPGVALPETPQQASSVSWGLVAAVAGGLAVTGAAVWYLSRQPKRRA